VALDGKTLLERPLVALADAPEAGFFGRLSDSVWLWFKGDQKVEISSTPNTQ
jgi:D-alanyl-D-alanine carboxypeptidase (penicillin-binding protein 5/6)